MIFKNTKLLLALACASGGLIAVFLGQDASWDYRNYHVYNAWAFLQRRWGTDFVPAQIQTFFNPLPDIPHYLATVWVSAPFASFLYGAFHTLVIYPLWHLSKPLLQTWQRVLVVATGFASPVFLYQLGLTVGDATTAVLVLMGVFGVLKADATSQNTQTFNWGALAIGAAVGLKLTNAPYGVALLLALCWRQDKTTRWAYAWRYVLYAGLGFVLAGGVWYAWVAYLYGNPLLPQFNNIFASPYAAAVGIVDQRWGPKTATELLLWPAWLVIRPYLFGENNTVVLTLAVALFAVYAALPVGVYHMWRNRTPIASTYNHWLGSLVIFFVASYGLWLLVFPVGRYLVVLDILAPLLLLVLAQKVRSKLATWGAALFVLLGALLTVYNLDKRDSAQYSPGSPWHLEVPTPWLATPKNLVFTGGTPTSWLLPLMGQVGFSTHLGGNYRHSPYGLQHIQSKLQNSGIPTYWVELMAETRIDQIHVPSVLPAATQLVQTIATAPYCPSALKVLGKLFYNSDLQRTHQCAERNTLSTALKEPPPQVAQMPTVDMGPLGKQVGMEINTKACTTHVAKLGANSYTLRLCPSEPKAR